MATEINMTERYFEWWLNELIEEELVISYEREPKSFELNYALPIYYHQHYKSKEPIVKNFNLFQPATYTPDYKVVFSTKLASKLFGIIDIEKQILIDGEFNSPGSVYQGTLFYTGMNSPIEDRGETIEVWFDVKPPNAALQHSAKLGSSREFPYNQRLMYEKHGIIINKVIPVGQATSLYCKTFMPRRYKFTDTSGALRKLKPYDKKARTIEEYLQIKNLK